jgi:molybdopterin-biosynthesis enzyme MoeA-like protein
VTAYIAESVIASPLRDIQAKYPHVDIGSYPFDKEGRYGTMLVARGTDISALDAIVEQIKAMLIAVGATPSE